MDLNPLQSRPIKSPNREIRLLRIIPPAQRRATTNTTLNCELTVVSLNSTPPPKYTALSYVWGDASHTRQDIIFDGHRTSITANLHEALVALSTHRGRETAPLAAEWLWIDAVCINQADVAERNAQVAMMKDIYRDASRVMVWLGPGDRYSDELIDWVVSDPSLDPGTPRSPHGSDKNNDALWLPSEDTLYRRAIIRKNILARPWFTRKWVLQELVLARADPLVVCGTREMSWTRFGRGFDATGMRFLALLPEAQARWRKAHRRTPWFGGVVGDGEANTNSFEVARNLRHDYAAAGGQLSLAILLSYEGTRAASDARDQVYGMLGMLRAEDAHLVEIDYDKKSPVQVMCEAFEGAWRTDADEVEDFWSFLYLWDRWEHGEKTDITGQQRGRVTDLPSWAVDLDQQGGRRDKDKACPYIPAEATTMGACIPYSAIYLIHKRHRWRRREPVTFVENPLSHGGMKTLILQGYLLDTIAHAEPTSMASRSNLDTPQGVKAICLALGRMERILQAGQKIPIPAASHRLAAALAELRTLQTCQQAFGDLASEKLAFESDPPMASELGAELIWEIALGRAAVPDDYRPDDPLRATEPEHFRVAVLEPLLYSIWCTCAGRKIVRTECGFTGVATPPVRVGDVVALVPGMGCPYVLRPVEGGHDTFRIVGFARMAGVAVFERLDVCVEGSGIELEMIKIV